MKRVTLDFETRSECDLKKSGAYKYSLDRTTKPTCLAWKASDGEVNLFDFHQINLPWIAHDEIFRKYWCDYIEFGFLFAAHNAFFERCIYENILVRRLGWPLIPLRQYRCTAAKAAACALPRNLAGAGEALKLTTQKDFRGYQAMMKICKPTKEYVAWEKKGRLGEEPEVFLEPDAAPDVWETLYTYCKIDVMAEELLDRSLPDLNPIEQEIWFLNQKLNWRGLHIDIPTTQKIVEIMEVEGKKKLKELDKLTMGLVRKPGARNSILEFLALEGIELPNLQKQTVEDKLQGFELSDDMRRLLEIRKALSLTSTKKYQAFLNRANEDDRVRDILMYHGASTGRDAGTGINPQNFPRGLIQVDKARPYALIENVIECDYEMLKILYGESLPLVFSAILRNMIIPTTGYEFFVADFSKVEVAILWWLADNEPGLKILRAGLDPYIFMAAANTGKPYQHFTESSPERQLGKAQVLAAGFGMGINGEKFKETAWAMHRLKLTIEQSKQAIQNYRDANPRVPELWKEYETAAINAVENPGSVFKAGYCKFLLKDKFLWVKLPSGRNLAYREPQITHRETEYGPRKTIEFWAVNSKTKKWGIERTWGGTLTENIVQATARDLLMQGTLRLERAGYQVLLTVHDEVICEKPNGEGNLEEFTKILCEIPDWAKGAPIEAKGWVGPRYRK